MHQKVKCFDVGWDGKKPIQATYVPEVGKWLTTGWDEGKAFWVDPDQFSRLYFSKDEGFSELVKASQEYTLIVENIHEINAK